MGRKGGCAHVSLPSLGSPPQEVARGKMAVPSVWMRKLRTREVGTCRFLLGVSAGKQATQLIRMVMRQVEPVTRTRSQILCMVPTPKPDCIQKLGHWAGCLGRRRRGVHGTGRPPNEAISRHNEDLMYLQQHLANLGTKFS